MDPSAGNATKQTPGAAIASLVLGILGLIGCAPLGIVGIICGHTSYSRIRKKPDEFKGEGVALAGIITSYLSLAMMIFIFPMLAAIAIPSFVRARERSRENMSLNEMKYLQVAIGYYTMDMGVPPQTLKDLVVKPMGPEAEKWNGPYIQDENWLTDAWGQPYQFQIDDVKGTVFKSLGKDGYESDDDIVYP